MKTMRSVIGKRDIFNWVDSFLGAAFAVKRQDFPEIEEYVPGL
jgi:hypothetical protein